MSYQNIIDGLELDKMGSESHLEIRKMTMIEGLIEGKTATKAAKDAGYGVGAQRTPWKLIPPDELRARFQEICERKGLTLDRLGAKIEQHLEAKMTQTIQGKEVTLSEAPDYRVQQKALDQLTSLMGMQDAGKAVAGGSSVTLSISGPAADRLAAMLGGD